MSAGILDTPAPQHFCKAVRCHVRFFISLAIPRGQESLEPVFVPDDKFMDFDARPKRSRTEQRVPTNSRTRSSAFIKPREFVQRPRNVSFSMPGILEASSATRNVVLARETPSQPVVHSEALFVTPLLFHGNAAMPLTPPSQDLPGGDAASMTPIVEGSKSTAPSFSIPVSGPMSRARNKSAVPPTPPAHPDESEFANHQIKIQTSQLTVKQMISFNFKNPVATHC